MVLPFSVLQSFSTVAQQLVVCYMEATCKLKLRLFNEAPINPSCAATHSKKRSNDSLQMGSAPSAPSADPAAASSPPTVDLLVVLDELAHGEHIAALHSFVTRNCQVFPIDADAEQPLVCSEVHRQYITLFEKSLSAAVARNGRVKEERFAEAMEMALQQHVEEAEYIMAHAAAAEDYAAFASLCRCRRHQLTSAGDREPTAQQREEMRRHIWGLQLRNAKECPPPPPPSQVPSLPRLPPRSSLPASHASTIWPDALDESLDGESAWLPLPPRDTDRDLPLPAGIMPGITDRPPAASCRPALAIEATHAARHDEEETCSSDEALALASRGDCSMGGHHSDAMAASVTGTHRLDATACATATTPSPQAFVDVPPSVAPHALLERAVKPPPRQQVASAPTDRPNAVAASASGVQTVHLANAGQPSRGRPWRGPVHARGTGVNVTSQRVAIVGPMSPDGFRSTYDERARERRRLGAQVQAEDEATRRAREAFAAERAAARAALSSRPHHEPEKPPPAACDQGERRTPPGVGRQVSEEGDNALLSELLAELRG